MAFAVIFFRLWYLQVLSGDRYEAQARGNVLREIKVQAPRGQIVDRNGEVLVDNRNGLALRRQAGLPARGRGRAARGVRAARRAARPEPGPNPAAGGARPQALPYSSATVKQDIDQQLAVSRARAPGPLSRRGRRAAVRAQVPPRRRPGAHLFGTVGEVTEDQLEEDTNNDVALGDRIGQSGIEAEYDRFLRGQNGASRVQVDAFGDIIRQLKRDEPKQGNQLRLSLDLGVQEAGQQALAGGTGKGAFAVLDIESGEVVALGSEPSFDPNIFTKPLSKKQVDRLYSKDLGEPIFNRAIQGGYPTGSTFKLITAVAALEEGVVTPEEIVNDPGVLTLGTQEFKNAGDAVNGPIAMRQALTVSSDVYFYKLGLELDSHGDRLGLQRWARRLGLGHATGIDLPSEAPGLVPTPRWRNAGYRDFERCKKREKPTDAEIALGECGFQDKPWTVGDNVNLSVGQGDLASNPLQMAVAYAAVANGGKVLRPRLGLRIEDATGRVIQQLEAPTARRVEIAEPHRQAILDGIFGAANDANGTSTSVFEGFPIQIAGKTGTAEKGGFRPDQSWYAALAPYPNPKYAVVVTDEAGGFGADTAAPMARRIMAELFDIDETRLVQGGEALDWMHASASTSPVRDFRDAGVRILRIDPLMLLATLGIIGASLYTIATATQDDIAGSPNYFVYRQAAYAGVGLVLMFLLSRFDYSRLREWKLGIYGFMIASILAVYVLGFSARGSTRSIEFPFFNFQASELGKLLLAVTLAAFMVDRMRRLTDRETTSRIVLLALVPAMLVVAQPDLGSGLVYLAILVTVLFVAGTPWTHLAGLAGLAAVAIVIVLVAAPAAGIEVLKPYQMDRLTAFLNPTSNPVEEPSGLPDRPVADRHRLRGEDRARRRRDADETRLPARAPHGLRVQRGGRGVRLRRGGARPVPVRAAHMARAQNTHDGQELLRRARCRRHHCDADVPGLRQRGHDDRNHAHHRHPPAAHELWRLVGAYDTNGHRRTPVDPRAGARNGWQEEPMKQMKGNFLEEAVARHGRPWRNTSRDPGVGGLCLRRI